MGGFASNGSGDYVITFSTNEEVRINTNSPGSTHTFTELENPATTPLFLAAIGATEEAILNSLFMAITVTGDRGHTQEALPIPEVLKIMQKYNRVKE